MISANLEELQYSKSLPLVQNMMRVTSASQRMASSSAFLKSPLLLLEKVSCLAAASSIFFIFILSPTVISGSPTQTHDKEK